MHEYDVLRELVKSTSATLVEEHLNPDVFGSAYAVFSSAQGGYFRLVWDGKDGCGFLQSYRGGSHWEATGPVVPESCVEDVNLISAFLKACETLVTASQIAAASAASVLPRLPDMR